MENNVRQQNQTQNQTPTQDSRSSKTLWAIILLILFWPAGLIYMWLAVSWSKVVKVIITVFFVILTGLSIYFVLNYTKPVVIDTLSESRNKATEAKITSDIRMIMSATELYNAEYDLEADFGIEPQLTNFSKGEKLFDLLNDGIYIDQSDLDEISKSSIQACVNNNNYMIISSDKITVPDNGDYNFSQGYFVAKNGSTDYISEKPNCQ